jgi:antitoxin (DNA-binding transcriptional repressor) of toxin-antitoxin stability system
MLEYFHDVETSGEELTATSDGVPVLEVVPIKPKMHASDVFADVRGKLEVRGDILETVADEWPEV